MIIGAVLFIENVQSMIFELFLTSKDIWYVFIGIPGLAHIRTPNDSPNTSQFGIVWQQLI